jgi:hypothetical protein
MVLSHLKRLTRLLHACPSLLQVQDPVLADAKRWGYQGLQPWQQEVLDKVKEGPLALLQQKAAALTG